VRNLQKPLTDIANCWADAIRRGETPRPLIPDACGALDRHLCFAVLTVWHPQLRDGRVLTLFAPTKKDSRRLLGLANLNLQVFPRGTTLNERFRAYSLRTQARKLTVHIDQVDGLLSWDKEKGLLMIGEQLWRQLSPSQEILLLRKAALDEFQHRGRGWSSDQMLNWAIENARPIRNSCEPPMRHARGEALDAIIRADSLSTLQQAAKDLSTDEDLQRLGVEPDGEVSIGHHFELLELFLCFIQALAHFHDHSHFLQAVLHQPDVQNRQDHSCSLILGSRAPVEAATYVPRAKARLKRTYTAVVVATQQAPIPVPSEGPPNRPELKALLKKWGISTWDSFIGRVMRVAELVSTDLHEGRRCGYAFILSSGAIWRAIEETISHEAAVPQPCVKEFARLIRSHWSIFQQPRCAGLIEYSDVPHCGTNGRMFLSKIVRLHAGQNGGELPSQVFRSVTGIDHQAIVICTRGDGEVLVFHAGKLAYRLDVKTGEEDANPEDDLDAIVRSALNACGIPEEQSMRNYLAGVLRDVIEQVSDAVGEGCLLLCTPERKRVGAFLGEMDRQDNRMVWRRPKSLQGMDASLLRALLILDPKQACCSVLG